ncbi:MAG TPA: hypothetical protein VF491_12365 [Vicinamibacterales bacterium]
MVSSLGVLMETHELRAQLHQLQEHRAQDFVPQSRFEELMLSLLLNFNATDYELADLLSEESIDLLLFEGAKHLKSSDENRVLMISGGEVVDLSYLRPMYQKLFQQWESRGWISCLNGQFERI